MWPVYHTLPVGALRERDDLNELVYAIADKKKVVVAQIAPAVRAAWGERFGFKTEDATVKRLVAALREPGSTMYLYELYCGFNDHGRSK